MDDMVNMYMFDITEDEKKRLEEEEQVYELANPANALNLEAWDEIRPLLAKGPKESELFIDKYKKTELKEWEDSTIYKVIHDDDEYYMLFSSMNYGNTWQYTWFMKCNCARFFSSFSDHRQIGLAEGISPAYIIRYGPKNETVFRQPLYLPFQVDWFFGHFLKLSGSLTNESGS